MSNDRPHWACGSCGYDLTGSLDAERCPECGSAFSKSGDEELGPNLVSLDDLPPHLRAQHAKNVRGDAAEIGTAPKPRRACTQCGYDLSGTPKDEACPECGAPPRALQKHSIREDQMANAPTGVLHRIRLSTLAMVVSAVAAVPMAVIALGSGRNDSAFGALVASTVWAAGTFFLTRPRNWRPGMAETPEREQLFVRRAAQITQAGWPLAAAGLAIAVAVPGGEVAGGVLGGIAALVGAGGMFFVRDYAETLNIWGGAEHGRAGHLLTIVLTIVYLKSSLLIWAWLAQWMGHLLSLPLGLLGGGVMLLCFATVWTLFDLHRTAQASGVTASHKLSREEERSERIQDRFADTIERQHSAEATTANPHFEADLAPIDDGPWRPPEETNKPATDLPPGDDPIPLSDDKPDGVPDWRKYDR